jgi:hypothetical protein
MRSRPKLRRWELIIKEALVLMAKTIKIIITIILMDSKLLLKLSKEVKVAMAAEVVSSPDPFNVGFKDVKIITSITGAIA